MVSSIRVSASNPIGVSGPLPTGAAIAPEAATSFQVLTPAPTTMRRYTLLRRLAVGGMGELLLAKAVGARGVEKLVAIKRVRSEYASDPAFVSMFVNEARLAATLDHPNVVRTYDLVEDTGTCFMVMEYLHGESLGRLLNVVAGRLPLAQVVTIALGVAAGLHCAHERRGVDGRPLDIVHRDLSPGNVFLTYEGGVKLLDFGIAKATSRTSITIGPTRKGKVAYMSPEQCVGADVDRRSDIFALGIILWEMCSGRRLFRGDNEFAIMNQVTTMDAPGLDEYVSEIPPELCEIVAKALRREVSQRFQTAMELHDAIEAFAVGHGLIPSSAALSRYLTEICGEREYPAAVATAEFGDAQAATLLVGGKSTVKRRNSVWLALIGGTLLGASAVAASSFARVRDEPPVRTEPAAAAESSPVLPSPTLPPATATIVPVPISGTPPAPPAASTSAEASASAEPTDPSRALAGTGSRATKRKASRASTRPRTRQGVAPAPGTAEPADTTKVRGVDGLLPRG